jgi:hypothetical protein
MCAEDHCLLHQAKGARPSVGQIFADHMWLPEVTCNCVEPALDDHYTKHLY